VSVETRARFPVDSAILTDLSKARAGNRRFLVFVLAALPLAVAAAFVQPYMQQGWLGRYYVGVHTFVETLVAVVAFATFAVQWYAAGARLEDARARFIGSAFLAVALLESLHIVAFPGMPGLLGLESSTERAIVYWLSARLWTVGALVAAIAIPSNSGSRLLRRGPLLVSALGGVALVIVVDQAWISLQPIFFVEGQGLTALKKGVEGLVAAAALLGAVLYGRISRSRRDRDAGDLSLALGLTVLSELCFTLFARVYDSFNLLGHVYLLLASYGVFHALFVGAVLRPYERLDATNAELHRLRAHVEGELAVTIARLQTVHEKREDLLRSVTHDLRTPVQVVLLQAERLARAAAGANEARAIESIANAGRQMRALLQDLGESGHLESGALQLSQQSIALRPFVSELVGVLRGALDTDRVWVEIAADLPQVAADPARLTRVVQNLVGNALKYSTPGTDVEVRAHRSDREVVVAVTDQGPGIPGEHLPRLFERYYRGAHCGTATGHGLGLYISRLIVEAHGGRIWCESKVGEGSTFSFTLPIDGAGRAAGAGTAPAKLAKS
jgi:signal transduction histidine kinase